MEYSYFIGLLTNISLDLMQWVFAGIAIGLFMISASALITFSKKPNQIKIFHIMGYFFAWLIVGGLIGFVSSSSVHFLTYAFINDFRRDYT